MIQVADTGTHALRDIRSERRTNAQSNTEGACNTSVYRQEVNKAKLGNNIANHMGFIFALALYDKFGLTFKQITNYYTKTVDKRVAWQDDDNDDVTSESMVEYCLKRKIDVIGWVKSIPMSQKLYMADIQKGRAVLGADRNIESALASTMYLTIPTLKESYRFECQDRGIYEVGCLLHRFLLEKTAEEQILSVRCDYPADIYRG